MPTPTRRPPAPRARRRARRPAPKAPALVSLGPAVRAALADGAPLVALESTLIAHGLPFPINVETALKLEAAVREEGAVPATIGVVDGRIVVGMEPAQLERFGRGAGAGVLKLSRRDLAHALAMGHSGATTVAATMFCARLAGIRLFATGGIGGVHRSYAQTLDLSADLIELGRTPVAVVSAGAKAILDLPRTLEQLETMGVPVIGYGTDQFPAFWSPSSGCRLYQRCDTPAQVAALLAAHWQLGPAGGVLIANPIPAAHAIDGAEVETAVTAAEQQAAAQGVSGKELTPFLLRRVSALMAGRNVAANIALVLHNAALAARIARAWRAAAGVSP